jgi:putative transposase
LTRLSTPDVCQVTISGFLFALIATSKTPRLVEWLSDNGSADIAKDTLDTATAFGLQLCFTPVRSPESNGIAEAFAKTFKRDYAR